MDESLNDNKAAGAQSALNVELDMSPEAQQQRAWRLVADTLNEVAPGWWKIGKTGGDSAAEYIRAVTILARVSNLNSTTP